MTKTRSKSLIKEYIDKIKVTENEVRKLNNKKKELIDQISKKSSEINKYKQKISWMNKNFIDDRVIIRDHACVRYSERILHRDLKKEISDLITDDIKEQVKELGGNCKIPVDDDIRVIFVDYQVITIESIKE
jgi:predicted RNase H-like nuclease (RuvC/YqgF family)